VSGLQAEVVLHHPDDGHSNARNMLSLYEVQ